MLKIKDNVVFTQYLIYKEVLQKYKKIVNGSERRRKRK